jgi:hypothetical protein
VARGHALRCYEIRSRVASLAGFLSIKNGFRQRHNLLVVLDGRIQPASPKRYDIPTAEIPPALNPVHYIFHAAFCCSMLLARYLERLKGAALPDTDSRRQAARDCSAGDCLSLM